MLETTQLADILARDPRTEQEDGSRWTGPGEERGFMKTAVDILCLCLAGLGEAADSAETVE